MKGSSFSTFDPHRHLNLARHLQKMLTSNASERDISDSARWSISSAKPGFGVAQLRETNADSYWQTDGPQPHHLDLQWYLLP